MPTTRILRHLEKDQLVMDTVGAMQQSHVVADVLSYDTITFTIIRVLPSMLTRTLQVLRPLHISLTVLNSKSLIVIIHRLSFRSELARFQVVTRV